MSANSFFTNATVRRHQLLRAFPHMTAGDGLRNARTPAGESKYGHVETSLQQRMSKGVEYTVAYTYAWDDRREFYANEFDALPSWRVNDDTLPHHFMVTAIVQLPFGEGRRWFAGRGLRRSVLGGWQAAGVYHLQSGRIVDWVNRFYYGSNPEDIALPRGDRDRARWFNTAEFEHRSAAQPAPFHRRVFPSRIKSLRGDYMNQLDLSLQREFGLPGGMKLQLRGDAINALNNVQWDRPNTDPTSSNFGVVTQQWNTPRWLQVQGRIVARSTARST